MICREPGWCRKASPTAGDKDKHLYTIIDTRGPENVYRVHSFYAHMFFSLYCLKSKQKHIHRGQLLEDVVKASGIKKEKVAEKAGYQRTSYYKHIKEPELPYHILTSYGKAINYDFTELLPEMPKYIFQEPEESYNKTLTLDEARNQIDYWKGKYIDLLEQFNKLVLEMKGRNSG